MANQALRQWQILKSLPKHPRKISTAQLEVALRERGYKSTRRTLERDLQQLSGVFPIGSDERSKPFGWFWHADGVAFDLPNMDVHTAIAFRLASEHLEPLLPAATRAFLSPWFNRAAQRLDEEPSNLAAAWPDKVRVLSPQQPRKPAPVDTQILETLQTALFDEVAVELDYRRRGETTLRTHLVHPHGIVYRDAMAYLVASIKDYDNAVHLALNRIHAVRPLEVPRRVPEGFSFAAYLDSGAFGFLRSSATLTLELRVHPEAAPTLVETPLSDDQTCTDEDDGFVRIRASVADTEQLRAWLLGYGALAEVIGPPALRAEIAERHRAAAAMYGGD